MKKRVYLDTASSTPLDKRVFEAMRPYFQTEAGNPASLYQEGLKAKSAVEEAREKIAKSLGAHADEIFFTSGGTESDNWALRGTTEAYGKKGHIIVSSIEHKAVIAPAQALEGNGWEVTYLPVSGEGIISLKDLEESLRNNTVLVSIMVANNEIGTIQPIKEAARVIRRFRQKNNSPYPYFHTDACQAPRFLKLAVESLGIDLLSLNGSKVYGPKGVGALYVRRGVKVTPLIRGGGQEAGLRSGTLNVPGIVGLGKAIELCDWLREKENKRLSSLRDYLTKELKKKFPQIKINGSLTERLSNNLNFSLAGFLGEQLVLELDAKGFAVSTGSACSSAEEASSHVLLAIGAKEEGANSSLRVSLGREAIKEDLKAFVQALSAVVGKLEKVKALSSKL